MVEISRDDNVGYRTERRDFFGYGRGDVAGRMQHDLARGEADRRHTCLEPRTRQSNGIRAKPYLIGNVAGKEHPVSSLASARKRSVNHTADGWFGRR